jgi:hypothetical protein
MNQGARGEPTEFDSILSKVRLLILGSYAPRNIGKISHLRNRLLSHEELVNSRLVEDFQTPRKHENESGGAYNLRKSQYWIFQADVLLFVFLGASDAGVMHELDLALSIPGAVNRTLVAYYRKAHITSLLQGILDKYKRSIFEIPFEKIPSLASQVRGCVLELCDQLYISLTFRMDGEWESISA